MRTHLSVRNVHDYDLPDPLRAGDVRYPSALVRHFLEAYTRPGDAVLDPFAGFGTTLYAAEAMGRRPYGIEIDHDKHAFVAARLASGRVLHGDARRLATYDLPGIDFSMTSPPYMGRTHRENPLTNYRTDDGDDARYLSELRAIYAAMSERLAPGARVVIEASNLKDEAGVTPLAWNIAERVAEVLRFEGEVIACWDEYGYGYDHSYCLVFSAP